jgi:hypothetical protein
MEITLSIPSTDICPCFKLVVVAAKVCTSEIVPGREAEGNSHHVEEPGPWSAAAQNKWALAARS